MSDAGDGCASSVECQLNAIQVQDLGTYLRNGLLPVTGDVGVELLAIESLSMLRCRNRRRRVNAQGNKCLLARASPIISARWAYHFADLSPDGRKYKDSLFKLNPADSPPDPTEPVNPIVLGTLILARYATSSEKDGSARQPSSDASIPAHRTASYVRLLDNIQP